MNKSDILDENLESSKYQIADKGSRLMNYIIDKIVFIFIIFLHAMILDGWLGIIPEEGSPFLGIYFFFLYVMYHSIFEQLFKKTPGKFITKSIVMKEDESEIKFKNILIRNMCRLIPFDPMSFMGSTKGWHDKLSKTKVVYRNK